MSNLTSSLVNGNLTVTGDIYGTGPCFLVDVTDSSAFNKMVAAYQDKRPIALRATITVSGASMEVIVPLTRVDVNSSTGNIIEFTFSKAREYGDYVGVIDVWWSTALSSGFVYDDPPATVYKSLFAASAIHSTSSSSCDECTGNATTASACTGVANGTAGRATNDYDNNNIINTYITKSDMNSLTAWMFVSNSSYNKYSSEGALIDYGTLTNTDSHYFDRVMQSAGYTNQVYYVGAITGEQMMVPGYYNWKTWVHYRFSITNIGTSYLTVKVVAGGMWGTTIYSGSVYYDGLLYTSDSSISSWTDGKRNQVTLSSVAPNTVRIWDIMWYADTKTFPSPVGTVTNHTVYVTTVH